MALDFYYGSGSPYAWRVWLALEHKRLPYEMRLMSFDKGDLKTAEYLRMNPRGRVPVLKDGDFSIYESAAIVEYLDQAYPASGDALIPHDAKPAAVTRRLVREADQYLATALEHLVEEVLFTEEAKRDERKIASARDAFGKELAYFEKSELGRGAIDAADFTVYPMIALAQRMRKRAPQLSIDPLIGPRLSTWMKKIEALPYYGKTYPPHWRAKT